jgi:tRNA (guanine37-N1)-methyltransferase
MRFDVLTLFPELIQSHMDFSIMKRASEEGVISVVTHNPRDYTLDKHKKVDDTPYGGGAGMVLMCQPIFDCVNKLKTDDSYVILLTPSGKVYNQEMAYDLADK